MSKLLAKQFVKPKPGWIARLFGDKESSYNYNVEKVESIDCGGFFEKHNLLRVFVADLFLEGVVLPGSKSYGNFAYDGERLLYLHGKPATRKPRMQELLQAEGKPLELCDPEKLGELFISCLLRRKNEYHALIVSTDSLRSYDSPRNIYKVDEQVLEKIAEQIRAPAIVGDTHSGWKLNVVTVSGWMDRKNNLSAIEFSITPTFEISTVQVNLSRRIFAQSPSLKY
ncbi:MAG: hypothetical protein SGJ27_07460 [Candidatus Melainabacteria bacterium]|nr:hypothetical protein [Candidatus Melainabacteria bacterium]